MQTFKAPSRRSPISNGSSGHSLPGAHWRTQPANVYQALSPSISASTAGPVVQRACSCGGSGPCHCDDQDDEFLQTKLRVNQPGDAYEQEAERVADAVVGAAGRTPAITPISASAAGTGQRKRANANDTGSAPSSVGEALRRSGRPIDGAVRGEMESHIGHDFGGVRIHTDRHAAESARSVNAHAYTVGRDIVFDQGAYAPSTQWGRHLLAHELTHVVQQQAGGQSLQRFTYGAGSHNTGGGNTFREATQEEREGPNGLDAALRMVQRLIDRNDARGRTCRQWFVDNCDPGTSLADLHNDAVIWVWRIADGSGGNGLTDGTDTENHAVTEQLLNVRSRWALAATIVHEYWHNCQDNSGADIGDDAKTACGLPNI